MSGAKTFCRFTLRLFNIQAVISTFSLLVDFRSLLLFKYPKCGAKWHEQFCQVIRENWQLEAKFLPPIAFALKLSRRLIKLFEAILIRKIYKAHKQKLVINFGPMRLSLINSNSRPALRTETKFSLKLTNIDHTQLNEGKEIKS